MFLWTVLLRKSMYGHRDVPKIRQTFLKHMLEQCGFCQLFLLPVNIVNLVSAMLLLDTCSAFKIFRVGSTISSNLVTG